MKIIKRSGSESQFDMEKIISAVIRANDSVAETERMSKEQIAVIAANMRTICEGMNRALSVEEIAKAANITTEETLLGMGWLLKEGKIKGEDNKFLLA